jgi:hypothetical protein
MITEQNIKQTNGLYNKVLDIFIKKNFFYKSTPQLLNERNYINGTLKWTN